MELRVLRYFLAVAEEGNLTRAAERLSMTQPSLSRQIAGLERELGRPLFERGRSGVRLTADGRLLRRRAEELVGMADRIELDFAPRGGELAGTLAVGSVEAYTIELLPRLLKAFLARAPHVRVEVFSGNADEVMERLDAGSLDFGLLREPLGEASLRTLALPGADVWGALLPASSPVAAGTGEGLAPAELAGERLLIPSRGALASQISTWFSGVGPGPEPMTYSALSAAVSLVRAGLGCAICPAAVVGWAGEGEVFLPLEPVHETRGALAWKSAAEESPVAQAFLGAARDVLGDGREAMSDGRAVLGDGHEAMSDAHKAS